VIPKQHSPTLRLGNNQTDHISAGVVSDWDNPIRKNRAMNVKIAQKAVMLLAKSEEAVDYLSSTAEARRLWVPAVVF
jgi:hypothetical protein